MPTTNLPESSSPSMTAGERARAKMYHRAELQSRGMSFFTNGCCVPTGDAFWMLLTMVVSTIALLGFFCALCVVSRWMYKRRFRKKCDKFREKYMVAAEEKKNLDMRMAKIRMQPSQVPQNLVQARESQRILSREVQKSLASRDQIRAPPLAVTVPIEQPMVQNPPNQPPLPAPPAPEPAPFLMQSTNYATSNSTIGSTSTIGSSQTSGTTGLTTGTDSKITVATVNEENNRFEMEHETVAATMGQMAKYCEKEKLNGKKFRTKGPILCSKNPRRTMAAEQQGQLPTPKTSLDNIESKPISPSEVSVSIPTPTSTEEDENEKKTKKKKNKEKKVSPKVDAKLPPKQISLSTIEESKEYQPEYSDKDPWKNSSTFPYYKDSSARKTQNLSNRNISPNVGNADKCLSTSATTRIPDHSESSFPASKSTGSWIPNVYEMRREADRQNGRRQSEISKSVQSRNTEESRNGYATKRATFTSPYDIRVSMEESDSQRSKRN